MEIGKTESDKKLEENRATNEIKLAIMQANPSEREILRIIYLLFFAISLYLISVVFIVLRWLNVEV